MYNGLQFLQSLNPASEGKVSLTKSAFDWLRDVYTCAVIGQLAPTVEHMPHTAPDTEAVGHSMLSQGEKWKCQVLLYCH